MTAATLVALEPAAPAVDGEPLATVKVWFGEHLIAHWDGPAAKAPAIARCWDRRWMGMRIEAPGVEW